MKHSLALKFVLPFMQWYLLMIFMAIGLDYALHHYHLPGVGRYLGYVGTFLLLVSFIYSLRKRKIMTSGSPKKWLMFHEYLAWGGSVLLLVHAGIHVHAILPWLAVAMLLIAVASGLVGKFVLKRSQDSLQLSRQNLSAAGMDEEAIGKKLFIDSIMVDGMKQWRTIHLPIAFIFALFSIMHIITVLMFNK